MKKRDVEISKVYWVKVSGNVVPVRLRSESPYGGWDGVNVTTGRAVRVKTAGRLRGEYRPVEPRKPTIAETVRAETAALFA